MNELIKSLYYDPKRGLTSLYKLYKKVHAEDSSIKLKDVRDFLQKQSTYQINHQDVKPQEYQSIYSPYPRYNYQLDLIIYDRYEIDKYKYILGVIDTHSRYAQCRALTNRENPTILSNLKDIFDVMGKPERINCDNEFNTSVFNKFWKENGISVYYSDPNEINKNAIIERFNRTIITLLQKFRTATDGKRKWYKYLPDLVDNYNHTYHRTIHETPADVFEGKKKSRQVFNVTLLGKAWQKFDVGTKVRLKTQKKVFDKGSEIGYSKDVYTIHRLDGRRYILQDSKGNILPQRRKHYELKRATEIQTYEPSLDVSDKVVQSGKTTSQQTQRKVKRELTRLKKTYTTATRPEVVGPQRQRKTKKDSDFVFV